MSWIDSDYTFQSRNQAEQNQIGDEGLEEGSQKGDSDVVSVEVAAAWRL